MSKPFLGRGAIVDAIKSRERTNSRQKREGLTEHPVRFTVCGCNDPNCAGWHTIETDRTVPSPEQCVEILRADNQARKPKKPRKT